MKLPSVLHSRVLFRPPARLGRRKGPPGAQTDAADRGVSATLVLGGCRSGKTAWAEEAGLKLLGPGGGDGSHYLIYIATAQRGGDPGLEARINRHRLARHPAWHTLEAPLDLPQTLALAMSGRLGPQGREDKRPKAVLIDCVTVWLANLMAEGHDQTAILERTDRLAELLRAPPCPVLLVSNETGLGVAPSTALGNQFRDVAGLVNQKLVKSCGDVYLIVSGLPQQLKSVSETSARRKFRPCRVCT